MDRPPRRRLVAAAIVLVAMGAVAALLSTGPAPRSSAQRGMDHAAGWSRVTIERTDGSSFAAILTYPALDDGEGAPYDDSGAPYAALSFGHGFLQTPDRYQGTFDHLARSGFLVVAPDSHTGILPDHEAFASDIGSALDWLAGESGNPESWLHAQVDTDSFGLSGHSMGGGAVLLTAADRASIRAVAPLAAADTRPSALEGVAVIDTPLAMIVGSEDAIVPPARTRTLYDAASAPKQFVTLVGGYHCGFQDDPFPIGCDSGTLTNEEQLALTWARLAAFFDLYLNGNRSRWDEVWSDPADPRVELEGDAGAGAPRSETLLLPWLRAVE